MKTSEDNYTNKGYTYRTFAGDGSTYNSVSSNNKQLNKAVDNGTGVFSLGNGKLELPDDAKDVKYSYVLDQYGELGKVVTYKSKSSGSNDKIVVPVIIATNDQTDLKVQADIASSAANGIGKGNKTSAGTTKERDSQLIETFNDAAAYLEYGRDLGTLITDAPDGEIRELTPKSASEYTYRVKKVKKDSFRIDLGDGKWSDKINEATLRSHLLSKNNKVLNSYKTSNK